MEGRGRESDQQRDANDEKIKKSAYFKRKSGEARRTEEGRGEG